jgi:hypothetical protein
MKDMIPKEILSKYSRTSKLRFDDEVEVLEVLRAFFVPDHNEEREYWKGFELVEWSSGVKELRVCYWTRKRGTESARDGRIVVIGLP